MKVRTLKNVPFLRYARLRNDMESVRVIPTYRVYRLYDNYKYNKLASYFKMKLSNIRNKLSEWHVLKGKQTRI